ncbi:hypothetical protein GGS23DRAFT_596113 [Durotheca rogersii]|uniref:uncharacterized protein n=1 Tax=Durotheca rogersii TaxID=419775 RepID=UPI00222107F3|nr:uncharacterized protein GGS23DRAFT_596113 [Durotheca rogersii]KAI5863602.1 hypothetical protein GGS23DRAFT_596113 [Durotheca rogersii]
MRYMGLQNRDRDAWEDFEVMQGDLLVSDYSVSLSNRAYITDVVHMNILPVPRMKHRNMVVDNYKSAGGRLEDVEYFVNRFILNSDAEYLNGATGWKELIINNPLLVGQIKMLNEYAQEFKHAQIREVTVAVLKPKYIVPAFFMVTRLTRPTAEEGRASG